MLLMASYYFYGAWDYRFLSLIMLSTAIDYFCGREIHKSIKSNKRKLFLCLSVIGNLSILGFFKYFNFFIENFQLLFNTLGSSINLNYIQVVLPVGISFYTFQTMSYSFDIYNKKIEPTNNIFDFALFVSFFPQLIAGPIEKARHLMPQILNKRKITLDYLFEGSYLIFWGLFLKSFVADNLAKSIVNPIFQSNSFYNGTEVLIALYAFSFQIFCDFAGYSSIARGIGKCMGFNLTLNFNLPYFSTNPKMFWQRWHISLSSWFKEYLYIPLGGNKNGRVKTYRNLLVVMFFAGLWHGAAWTYILWGTYHATLLIVYRLANPVLERYKMPEIILLKKLVDLLKIIIFYHLVCIGWLIFRADSIAQAYQMFFSLFNDFEFSLKGVGLKTMIYYLWILLPIQIFQYWKNDYFVVFSFKPIIQILLYLVMFYSLLLLGVTDYDPFIYFQF
tara:strand:+ start:805 stop:2142 length:1338 start_codon:yes stop_codon:yes gene_type:complete